MQRALALAWLLASSAAHAADPLVLDSFKSKSRPLTAAYALYLPPEAQKAAGSFGLVAWFHADGGGAGYADTVRRFGPELARVKLATLAVRAPAGPNWHDAPDVNGPFADELIGSMILPKHGLDRRRVVFAGASGGAVFVSGMFLPRHGAAYRGGAVLLCGGAPSLSKVGRSDTRYFDKPAGFTRAFKLYFKVQKGDYIHQQSKAGAQYYESLGFDVRFEEPSGGGHCGFDMLPALLDGVRAVLR
jgi:hypothetical protein